MAVLASLLALLSSFAYNIAITRKIPTAGLGLLSLLNASIVFSLLPTALLNFAYPRLTARDGGLNLRAALIVSSIFYAITTVLTIGYLISVWSKMGQYALLVLVIALMSEITYYVQSVTNSVLMVKDRSRFLITSIVQSIVKILVIPAIMLLGWSISAVLWSSFIIVFIPTLLAFIYTFRFHVNLHSASRYLREVVSASWVPLMGYAINSFRSLDAMFIGLLGYAQLGIWYVIFILSKPLGYGNTLVNVTYGELLERNKLSIIYRDFLIILFTSTYVAIALSVFPGVYINLVRPSMRNEINLLILPVVLMVANAVLGNVNQFISNVMQGIDKRDITSGSEIRPRVYLRSLILYTHLAELVFTAVYLSTMIPLILLFKSFSITYYAVVGALVSSLLANISALGFRFIKIGSVKGVLNGKGLIRDYALPSLISILVLIVIRRLMPITLYPSILSSLAQVFVISLLVLVIYLGVSMSISRNIRVIIMVLVRRFIKAIITSQP